MSTEKKLSQIWDSMFDERGVYEGDRYQEILPWTFSRRQVQAKHLVVLVKAWSGCAIATYDRLGAAEGHIYLTEHEGHWYVLVINSDMGLEEFDDWGDDQASAWHQYREAVQKCTPRFDLEEILELVDEVIS